MVLIELIQKSPKNGAFQLATYCDSASSFLYPYFSLTPVYASSQRELLMSRSPEYTVSKLVSLSVYALYKKLLKITRKPCFQLTIQWLNHSYKKWNPLEILLGYLESNYLYSPVKYGPTKALQISLL